VEDVQCRLLCFCRCVVVHIQLHSLPMVPSLMKSISQALKQKKCHLVDRLLCCDCTHPGRRYPYLQSPGCGSFSLSLSLSHFCNSMTRAALCWGGRWRLWLWPLSLRFMSTSMHNQSCCFFYGAVEWLCWQLHGGGASCILCFVNTATVSSAAWYVWEHGPCHCHQATTGFWNRHKALHFQSWLWSIKWWSEGNDVISLLYMLLEKGLNLCTYTVCTWVQDVPLMSVNMFTVGSVACGFVMLYCLKRVWWQMFDKVVLHLEAGALCRSWGAEAMLHPLWSQWPL
jgi:hypothetical protein